jgi:hypothetical protein
VTVCDCGSGLPPAACCALDIASLRPAEPRRPIRRRLDEARVALRAGDTATVIALCTPLLTEAPGLVPALQLLMVAHGKRGKQATVWVLNARLGRLVAGSLVMLLELVGALVESKAWDEAEPHARNAVRTGPGNAEAQRYLGIVLTGRMLTKEGEYHLRQAVALEGGLEQASTPLRLRLAENVKQQGRLVEAERLVCDVLATSPNLIRALLLLAEIEEQKGRLDEAEAALARAEALEPGHPAFRRVRAELAGRRQDYAGVVAMLTPPEASQPPVTADELLLKGRALDRLGQYDAAFTAFETRSRMLLADGVVYRPEEIEAMNQACKRFFRKPVVEALPRAGTRSDGPQPVFVMGWPRSGTTMVEQSLSMHPRITAAGEIRALPRLAANAATLLESPLAYPDCLSDLWFAEHRAGLDVLRDAYLREAAEFVAPKPGAAWFTDKMLFNQLHLGLIGLVFPRSPVLHVVRHPLDVILSVFSHELALRSGYAASLEAAARHYVLHMDTLRHYLAEMPGLRHLRVRYEDIVDAQVPMTRRMLAFIGENFDEACLRFHENERPALTLSSRQVKERLNTKGRYRYRHYLRHLAPVIPVLEPWIRYFGYDIETGEPGQRGSTGGRVPTDIKTS